MSLLIKCRFLENGARLPRLPASVLQTPAPEGIATASLEEKTDGGWVGDEWRKPTTELRICPLRGFIFPLCEAWTPLLFPSGYKKCVNLNPSHDGKQLGWSEID